MTIREIKKAIANKEVKIICTWDVSKYHFNNEEYELNERQRENLLNLVNQFPKEYKSNNDTEFSSEDEKYKIVAC